MNKHNQVNHNMYNLCKLSVYINFSDEFWYNFVYTHLYDSSTLRFILIEGLQNCEN